VIVADGDKKDLDDLHAVLAKRYHGKRVFFLYTEPTYAMDEIRLLGVTEQNLGELKAVAEYNVAGAMLLQMR